MFVICINNEGAKQFVSEGKTYKILDVRPEHFIIDCNGRSQKLYKSRFEFLTCDNCIDRKCNSCKLTNK